MNESFIISLHVHDSNLLCSIDKNVRSHTCSFVSFLGIISRLWPATLYSHFL